MGRNLNLLIEQWLTQFWSLLWQSAMAGVTFAIMLVLTGGNPSGLTLAIVFFLIVVLIACLEARRHWRAGVKESAQDRDKWTPLKVSIILYLINANFINANLRVALLRVANLRGADLWGANLRGANLRNADLSSANLSGAVLWGANLSGANLRNANLRGAVLWGANLSSANLSGAIIDDTTQLERKWRLVHAIVNQGGLDQALSGADLSGAVLSGADLSDFNFSGANLSDANLSDANLNGANLSNANLSDANLSTAEVSSAFLISNEGNDFRATLLDGDGNYHFSRADLRGADLRGANLSRADLRGADLRGANLRGANLRDAIVSGGLFGTGIGLEEAEKIDLRRRGAIFDEATGDRGAVDSPVPSGR